MPTKIINILKDDKFQDILDIFRKTSAQEVIFVLPKKHKALAKEGDFEILSAVAEEHGKNVLILTSNPEINNLALEYSFGVLASEKPESNRPKKSAKVGSASGGEKPPEPEAEAEAEAEVLEEPLPSKEEENTDDKDDDDRWNNEGGAQAYYQQENYSLPKVDPERSLARAKGTSPKDLGEATSYGVELAAVKKPIKMVSDIVKPSREDEKVKVEISKKTERFFDPPVRQVGQAGQEGLNVKREPAKTDINEIESVWQRPVRQPTVQSTQPSPPVKRPSQFEPGQIIRERRRFSFANLSKKSLTFLGAGVVVLFAVVIYVSTGSAQVSIKLRAYPLDLNLKKVTTSDKFLAVDLELQRIPGQLFHTEKNIKETFPATGERDVAQKARGKITVYNEYGTTPQVLIATTRFESEKGLIFRTLQTVTVLAAKVQNGKITPGSIEVDVIADKAGDTYNVAAGKFTIPAFKEKGDIGRYQKFYGISGEKMKGGIIGKAKVVTEQDYINAKKKIEEIITSETEEELKTQAAGLKILSLSQPFIKEITSTAQIDEATDDFTLSGKAELETVGFKESDLHVFVADYVGKINDLMVLSDKLGIEFKDATFNKEEKTLEFRVLVKGSAYRQADKDKIISDLIGKNEQQIKDYLKGIEGVVSAKVVLSPFWIMKVPANKEKIKFELQYE